MWSARAYFEKKASALSRLSTVEVVEQDDSVTIKIRPNSATAVGVVLHLSCGPFGIVQLDDSACAPAELGDDPLVDRSAIDYFIDAAVEGRAVAFHLGNGGCVEIRDGDTTRLPFLLLERIKTWCAFCYLSNNIRGHVIVQQRTIIIEYSIPSFGCLPGSDAPRAQMLNLFNSVRFKCVFPPGDLPATRTSLLTRFDRPCSNRIRMVLENWQFAGWSHTWNSSQPRTTQYQESKYRSLAVTQQILLRPGPAKTKPRIGFCPVYRTNCRIPPNLSVTPDKEGPKHVHH